MKNSIFGELVFNTGWKTKIDIKLFNNHYSIFVKAKAYYETDGITKEQVNAFSNFKNNESNQLKNIEKMLNDLDCDNAKSRFTPRTLLFLRDGSYAMLFDDKRNEDDGIAVCIAPTMKMVSQDEYL